MKYALALCLIAGCGVSAPIPGNPGNPGDPADPGDPASPGDPADPGDPDPGVPPSPPPPTLVGPYQLVSRIDLTAEAILPDQAEQVVSTLRALATNPAHALLTLADEAGVPAVGELYALLPGLLEDRLEGWINDEIARVEIRGEPVTAYAGWIAGLADAALTQFAVDSELTIDAGAARHRLTALDLTPAGLPVTLPLGGLAGDLLTQDTTATAEDGRALRLGEQHFGLGYGEYAWQAVEAVSRQVAGGGVRDALGGAIDCPHLAHSVAGKCVLGVCVGHEAELTAICEGGLDAIVDFAHGRMAALRFDVLHLAAGDATLADDDRDGVIDRITTGTWQAELDLGLGLRRAPATFTGMRAEAAR